MLQVQKEYCFENIQPNFFTTYFFIYVSTTIFLQYNILLKGVQFPADFDLRHFSIMNVYQQCSKKIEPDLLLKKTLVSSHFIPGN